eukprot:scaffold79071_cov121-Phaeocystis_antarctica.AAC.2
MRAMLPYPPPTSKTCMPARRSASGMACKSSTSIMVCRHPFIDGSHLRPRMFPKPSHGGSGLLRGSNVS